MVTRCVPYSKRNIKGHQLYVHSPTEGQLDGFQVWAMINKATIKICLQMFVWSAIAVSYAKTVFSFVKNKLPDCLQRG